MGRGERSLRFLGPPIIAKCSQKEVEMICEQCQEENRKSTIRFSSANDRPRLPADYFYDEEGRFHSHDPNDNDKTVFTCSNGHTWSEIDVDKCEACKEAGVLVRPVAA